MKKYTLFFIVILIVGTTFAMENDYGNNEDIQPLITKFLHYYSDANAREQQNNTFNAEPSHSILSEYNRSSASSMPVVLEACPPKKTEKKRKYDNISNISIVPMKQSKKTISLEENNSIVQSPCTAYIPKYFFVNADPFKNLSTSPPSQEPERAKFKKFCTGCNKHITVNHKAEGTHRRHCTFTGSSGWMITQKPTLFYRAYAQCPFFSEKKDEHECLFVISHKCRLGKILRLRETLQSHCKRHHPGKTIPLLSLLNKYVWFQADENLRDFDIKINNNNTRIDRVS